VVILVFGVETGRLVSMFFSYERRDNGAEDLDRLCRVDTLDGRDSFEEWLKSLEPVLSAASYECRLGTTGGETENRSVGAMRLKVERDFCAARSEEVTVLRRRTGLRESASAANENRRGSRGV
jgi:hypothetical protein